MSILATAAHVEQFGNQQRRLLITNREIERFEMQHGGIYDLWDQLFGQQHGLKATHVRDLVALSLVGGGLTDTLAEALVSGLGPEQNMRLRQIAQRALGLAFFPDALVEDVKKNAPVGSAEAAPEMVDPAVDTMRASGSETSAA